MYGRPHHFCSPIVHPTKCCVNHSFSNNVVPHIHPSHTTNVHHTNFDHVHYTTHTQSNVNQVTQQHHFGGQLPAGYGGLGYGGPGYGGLGYGR